MVLCWFVQDIKDVTYQAGRLKVQKNILRKKLNSRGRKSAVVARDKMYVIKVDNYCSFSNKVTCWRNDFIIEMLTVFTVNSFWLGTIFNSLVKNISNAEVHERKSPQQRMCLWSITLFFRWHCWVLTVKSFKLWFL